MNDIEERIKALPDDEPLYWDDDGYDYYCNHQETDINSDDLKALVARIDLLTRQRDAAVEALQKYGDKTRWGVPGKGCNHIFHGKHFHICDELEFNFTGHGWIPAQSAIAEIEGTK